MLVLSYTSAFLKQSGISSEYMREAALPHLPWCGPMLIAAAGVAEWSQGQSSGTRMMYPDFHLTRVLACIGESVSELASSRASIHSIAHWCATWIASS
jgi:hypothetical protein